MSPSEKLLLRRPRNSDIKRSAQWMANLANAFMSTSAQAVAAAVEIEETLEHYGLYAETEDPDALVNAELELGRALRETNAAMAATRPLKGDSFVG